MSGVKNIDMIISEKEKSQSMIFEQNLFSNSKIKYFSNHFLGIIFWISLNRIVYCQHDLYKGGKGVPFPNISLDTRQADSIAAWIQPWSN